jgi:ParB/Sulfiredoxin domain
MVERRKPRGDGATVPAPTSTLLAEVEGFPVEWVDVGTLKPHPRNYREHPPEQLAHIVRSVEEHGFYRAIVVAREGTIIAGHGLYLAAQQLGKLRVPILRLDLDPLDPRALKILVGDNEVAHLADINDRVLVEVLNDLKNTGGEAMLLGSGYDAQTLAALAYVTRPPDQFLDKNEEAEWVGMPEYSTAPAFRIMISCDTEAGRLEVLAKIGLKETDRTRAERGAWSFWWPPREVVDEARVTLEFKG